MRKVAIHFLLAAVLSIVLNGCRADSPPPNSSPTIITLTSIPFPVGNTIIVASSEDIGTGTLRQALLDAQPGDIILFDDMVFPPGQPTIIYLESTLPGLTQGYLSLDASGSQVILDGSRIPAGWESAIQVGSNGNIVRGFQITNFSGAAIHISNGEGNIIQGNVIINSNIGIGLWGSETLGNQITGNFLGVASDGITPQGNKTDGILIQEAAHDNQIGPGNQIAFNNGFGVNIRLAGTAGNVIFENTIHDNLADGIIIQEEAHDNRIGPDNQITNNNRYGVSISSPNSTGNAILQNNIYNNGRKGIDLSKGGNNELAAPVLTFFDPASGSLNGTTCPNCEVMIYSSKMEDGLTFIGQIMANEQGTFTNSNNIAFEGSCIIATTTDLEGNTSEFYINPKCPFKAIILQNENNPQSTQLDIKTTGELINNRIGSLCAPHWCPIDEKTTTEEHFTLGLKGMLRLSLNEIEGFSDGSSIDWSSPEFTIAPAEDAWVSMVSENLTAAYILTFWDKENHPNGWTESTSRFSTEEDIERYLDYVEFIVLHFKDRIHYYEIWNEPDNPDPAQYIKPSDYINLVKRAVPIIKGLDPEAKIIVGGTMGLHSEASQEYLFAILNSDIMPIVDVIAWHPFFGVSPEYQSEYYYAYPALVQEIKDVATGHGFKGEYRADEFTWRSTFPGSDQPTLYSNPVAAKYYLRGMLMNLGLDVDVGIMVDPREWVIRSAIGTFNTLMDLAKPEEIIVEIQSEADAVTSYGFILPNGDRLLAVWSDVAAKDSDPGVASTLMFAGFAGWSATGMDVMFGVEQVLVSSNEHGDLVIRDLLIKDFPILIRLSK